MELLSLEFHADSVELTVADAPLESDAKTLLIARIPFEVQPNKTLAWNRYWALKNLEDALGALVRNEREILESR